MTDREKYLFDLQGFLVVRGVLDDAQLERMNEAVDANLDQRKEAPFGEAPPALAATNKWAALWGMLTWEHPWCEPFRELIVPVPLIRHLDTLLGRGWKSGESNLQLMHAYTDTAGLTFHLGDPHFSHMYHYVYGNGQIRNGLLSIQYQLTDVPAGAGGFCCIPGSHKANFLRPAAVDVGEDLQEIIHNPVCAAGDAIIFTEALTHGTLPWQASHERRSLLWRFFPAALGHWNGFAQGTPPWFAELTDEQRAVLTPATSTNLGGGDQQLIARDGSLVSVAADYDEPPARYSVSRTHLYDGPPDWIEPPGAIESQP